VLSADGSCQKAVNEAIVNRLLSGLAADSANTGGYCRARQRLPTGMVYDLVRQTGALLSEHTPAPWLWRGRHLKLVDGTTDPATLKALLKQQQCIIEQQRKDLDRKQRLADQSQQQRDAAEQRLDRFREKIIRKQGQLELLEERLGRLLVHRFGRRSEINPDQFQLFNEAELLVAIAEGAPADEVDVPAHKRRCKL